VAEALRFECQPGCTACCTQRGFVYLSDADIHRAAAFVQMSPADFERKFIYRTRKRARLRVPRDANCHFLLDGGCSIHPAKPTQCRTFPFWPELVDSRRAWRQAARFCPGIDKGPLIHIEKARDIAQEMRDAYPALY
jgi:Fe-S-cluster containining protein